MRRVGNDPRTCNHAEHNPPSYIHYDDGVYEHACPGCSYKQQVVVRHPTRETHTVEQLQLMGACKLRWGGIGTCTCAACSKKLYDRERERREIERDRDKDPW